MAFWGPLGFWEFLGVLLITMVPCVCWVSCFFGGFFVIPGRFEFPGISELFVMTYGVLGFLGFWGALHILEAPCGPYVSWGSRDSGDSRGSSDYGGFLGFPNSEWFLCFL